MRIKKLFITAVLCMLATNINALSHTALMKNHKSVDNVTLPDTIDSILNTLRSGRLTCVDVIKQYLTRIKKYDLDLSRGAPINAFVSLNPNIISEAIALDDYQNITGHFMGPLHCIPIIVKDNIDTVDSPSTSGSLSLLGSQPVSDAFLVKKLRDAGGIIIGKGAMDEFASGMSGISSKSGRVGNAIDPNKNPGGSSSGPAAAVAANFAVVGIGTDNSGSVRIPAAFNGVEGLRPSTGVISQTGIFPRGNLDGVAGVIAKNIKDMAVAFSVIASTTDPYDPKTEIPKNRISSYQSYLSTDAFKSKRIGIITSVHGKKTFDENNKAVNKIFNNTFSKLRKLGATLIYIELPKFNSDREDNMSGEVQDINDYLSSFPSTRQSYRDICTSGRTQTFIGIKGCLDHIHDTAPKYGKIYSHVLNKFSKNREYVQKLIKDNNLTAMIMPLNADGGPSYNIKHVNTWRAPVSSNSGLPAITIIGGYTGSNPSMPVGLELIGNLYSEGDLMGLAYAYQEHFPNKTLELAPISESSSPLIKMSIEEINNLFTLIGYDSTNQILKYSKSQVITPMQITHIVQNRLNKL